MQKLIPVFNSGLKEFYPIFCGYENCCKGQSYGPAIRDYFLIHYIMKGKGGFLSSGREYCLSKGQCFLIRPNEIAFYKADEHLPWDYVWIAFSGENSTLFLKSAGIYDSHVFGNERISNVFEELHRQIAFGMLDSERNEFGVLSLLYALFAALPPESVVESQCKLYIRKVRNYVTKMISYPISIEHLANYCGLDRHYLCRIFKEQTGLTLQDYMIDCKMRKAKNLLLFSPLNVGDLARSVGYNDTYNFSKMFKKHFGVSPSKLRHAKAEDVIV